MVFAGIAVGVALLLGRGFDLVLIGLIAAFLVLGGLGFALRFLPSTLPLVPTARSALGFLALATLAVLVSLYVYPLFANGTGPGRGFAPAGPSVSLTRQATVVYSLTGSAGARVSAASPLPSGDSAPETVDQLPWEKSVQLTVDRTTPGTFTLVAIGLPAGDDAQLACTITLDGTVVAHEESTGEFRSVFCSGTP
ncbi:hypothetical protein [Subtercola boreus]|uniref:hypothetical protein n=1 Tax=Subtercola boreus TaxID=120213 RepID=UPI001153B5FB|nr:hypothetical protein [Subtercola boreus]